MFDVYAIRACIQTEKENDRKEGWRMLVHEYMRYSMIRCFALLCSLAGCVIIYKTLDVGGLWRTDKQECASLLAKVKRKRTSRRVRERERERSSSPNVFHHQQQHIQFRLFNGAPLFLCVTQTHREPTKPTKPCDHVNSSRDCAAKKEGEKLMIMMM